MNESLKLPLTGHPGIVLLLIAPTVELGVQEMLDADSRLPKNIYKLLDRLEAAGWIASRSQKIRGERNRPRRFCRLTRRGKLMVHFHQLLQKVPVE